MVGFNFLGCSKRYVETGEVLAPSIGRRGVVASVLSSRHRSPFIAGNVPACFESEKREAKRFNICAEEIQGRGSEGNRTRGHQNLGVNPLCLKVGRKSFFEAMMRREPARQRGDSSKISSDREPGRPPHTIVTGKPRLPPGLRGNRTRSPAHRENRCRPRWRLKLDRPSPR